MADYRTEFLIAEYVRPKHRLDLAVDANGHFVLSILGHKGEGYAYTLTEDEAISLADHLGGTVG